MEGICSWAYEEDGISFMGEYIDVSSSILAASHMETTSATWLCDTGASHDRAMFTYIEPTT